MDKGKWLQLILSAVSLCFGLVLDLYYPSLKGLVCVNLPNGQGMTGSVNADRYLTPSTSTDREK